MNRMKMKIYALILVILFLSACSRIDLVLSYAPRYIVNEIDDAFDLSSERYKKIKSVIADDINKNKNIFLSEIVVQIEYLLLLTDKKDLSADEVKYIFNEIKELQKRLIIQFKPTFSIVLLPLSQAELDHLNIYTTEKFSKSDEKFKDRQKYYKNYFKMYDHYMDIFFNGSNNEQEKSFKDFLNTNYEYFKLQNQIRKDFVKQFGILFKKKENLLEYTMKYYAGDNDIKSEEYLKKQKIFYSNIMTFFRGFWKEASVDQKLYFRKKLINIKDEMKILITKD